MFLNAVCDLVFSRDQDLLVVGGGDSAAEEAIFLTQFAKTVNPSFNRRDEPAQKVLQDRAPLPMKNELIWDSVVKEIMVKLWSQLSLKVNVKTNQVTEHAFGGVFIYVGFLDPVSDFTKIYKSKMSQVDCDR